MVTSGFPGQPLAARSLDPDSGPSRRVATAALGISAAAATYALLVLGSTVRVTGSGMGCPGWPLCSGHVGLAPGAHAHIEQYHRYLAALVTVLVAATLAATWRDLRRARGRSNRDFVPERHSFLAASGSTVIVVVQVFLGAVTVLTHNAPWTVALHLAAGLLLGAATTATAVLALFARRPRVQSEPARRHAMESGVARRPPLTIVTSVTAVASTFAAMVTGSLVVDGGAVASCTAWPACPAGAPARLQALQLVHRGTVALASVAIVAFAIHAAVNAPRVPPVRALTLAVILALAAQVLVGAVTATLAAPPGWQNTHLAIGSFLWLLVVALATAVAPASHAAIRPSR